MSILRRKMMTTTPEVIVFEDANVKALCVSNWGGKYVDGEITKKEAAAVTSIGTVFKGNTTITKFNELEYFTGLHTLNDAFNGCSALTQIKLPHTTWSGNFSLYRTFYECSAITGTLDCSPIKANTVTSISECFCGCHARTLIMPTTNRINQSIGWCFRGIRTLVLDLSPLAGSHLTIPNYCFYSWGTGSTNVETLITTGVYLNGASDNVILWHDANPCKVTTFIGGFMGWNKNLNLTYMPNIGRDGAMEVINSLPTVNNKTLTFASAVFNRVSSDITYSATSKGWLVNLWHRLKINGVNMPFGITLTNLATDDNGINITSNMSATIYKDGVDTSATDIVNGFIRFSNNAENAVTLTTNTNSGTIVFSGTATTSVKDSKAIFSASQNGWYKVTLNIDSNTTVLGTSAKGTAVQIRRYTPYATRCMTSASVDYDYWEFVNVESFVAGATIEAYGYMGIGDFITIFDTLSGSATFNVELVSPISIPSGYAVCGAMPLELNAMSISEGLRITHSIDAKFKLNRFNTSDLYVGRYSSTNRAYCIGRNSSSANYTLYTYWGKAASNPATATLVNSTMLNNVLQFTASSTSYTVKRYNNGTKYTANYGAASKTESAETSFTIQRCNCFWLRLWNNGTMVKELVPLVDTATRETYRLYDLVEGVFFDRP